MNMSKCENEQRIAIYACVGYIVSKCSQNVCRVIVNRHLDVVVGCKVCNIVQLLGPADAFTMCC